MDGMRIQREKKDITQKQLADIIGCASSTIANYETGKREPSIAVLCAIADALDCSLDALIRGKEKDRPGGQKRKEALPGHPGEGLFIRVLARQSACVPVSQILQQMSDGAQCRYSSFAVLSAHS